MIDIYDEVYTKIATAMREAFPGLYVTGEDQNFNPAKLPCLSIVDADNYVPRGTTDSSLRQKYANVALLVAVYSSRESGKRKQAKDILNAVDEMLFALNFTRESRTPQTPLNNSAVFWMAARYTAETDGTNIYRQ